MAEASEREEGGERGQRVTIVDVARRAVAEAIVAAQDAGLVETSIDPPPVWAQLPADRQKQLHDLLGQLLARLHAANVRGEVGHE